MPHGARSLARGDASSESRHAYVRDDDSQRFLESREADNVAASCTG